MIEVHFHTNNSDEPEAEPYVEFWSVLPLVGDNILLGGSVHQVKRRLFERYQDGTGADRLIAHLYITQTIGSMWSHWAGKRSRGAKKAKPMKATHARA